MVKPGQNRDCHLNLAYRMGGKPCSRASRRHETAPHARDGAWVCSGLPSQGALPGGALCVEDAAPHRAARGARRGLCGDYAAPDGTGGSGCGENAAARGAGGWGLCCKDAAPDRTARGTCGCNAGCTCGHSRSCQSNAKIWLTAEEGFGEPAAKSHPADQLVIVHGQVFSSPRGCNVLAIAIWKLRACWCSFSPARTASSTNNWHFLPRQSGSLSHSSL